MFRLEIVNFQSIEYLNIDIDGFTVVKGRSSSGKSAIRRAIRFLLHNDWDKRFLRNGTKECRVTLRKEGDWAITRVKGDKKNSYIVEKDGKTSQYDKIGVDVPSEFSEMGISLLECEGFACDVMVYCQRDPLFMMAYSPVEKTHVLNRLFGTFRCESAAKLVKRDIVSNKTRLNQINVELDDAKKSLATTQEIRGILADMLEKHVQLRSLATLRDLNLRMGSLRDEEMVLDRVYSECIFALEKVDRLGALQEWKTKNRVVEDRSLTLDSTEASLKEARLCEGAMEKADGIRRLADSESRMSGLEGFLSGVDAQLSLLSSLSDTESSLDLLSSCHVAEKKLVCLESVQLGLDESSQRAKCLLLLSVYGDSLKKPDALRSEADSLDGEVGRLRESLPEVCPTCGQPFPSDFCS